MEAKKFYVVIPNWNGAERIQKCLSSLKNQSQVHKVIVVDNGSIDDSVRMIEAGYPEVSLIKHSSNKGFAGGVNAGIRQALEEGAEFVALINNDAVADRDWLKKLGGFMQRHEEVGIATSKILGEDGKTLDSTGEYYTIWGLPYSRGRGEKDLKKYDSEKWVFGASGGASLYRAQLFRDIGLFDDDFFAYYEDVDISFRAQLAGWKVAYVPDAIVRHEIGATSATIKGFTTYQTLKNLPMLMWKNVPASLLLRILPRYLLLYLSITASALSRGQLLPVVKGVGVSIMLWPKKMFQRYEIQRKRKVQVAYIGSMIKHDLPPNAHKLRRLRNGWWKLMGRTV